MDAVRDGLERQVDQGDQKRVATEVEFRDRPGGRDAADGVEGHGDGRDGQRHADRSLRIGKRERGDQRRTEGQRQRRPDPARIQHLPQIGRADHQTAAQKHPDGKKDRDGQHCHHDPESQPKPRKGAGSASRNTTRPA
jgi:hypothetical protein